MKARMGEERGRGFPLSDVERVMRHYNIDEVTARYYLSVHPIEMLVPERGYGLTEAIPPPPGGPHPIGLLAAVAAGAWTDIVSIVAPVSAKYGDLLNIKVMLRISPLMAFISLLLVAMMGLTLTSAPTTPV